VLSCPCAGETVDLDGELPDPVLAEDPFTGSLSISDDSLQKVINKPLPTKRLPRAEPQSRPRTASGKERLPIFQVLCTEVDEETIVPSSS